MLELRRVYRAALPSPFDAWTVLLAISVLAVSVLALLNACSGREPERIEIRFDAVVGEQPGRCGVPYTGVGAGGGVVELGDARLYVSELELRLDDGTWVPIDLDQETPWQHANVALLDFEDASGRCSEAGTAQMNSVVQATVPAGTYRGLRFALGVPHSLNHLDAATAPSPLNLNALYWNWRLGYIFTKVEFWNPGVDSVVDPEDGAANDPDIDADNDTGEKKETPSSAAMPPPGPTVTYLVHIGSTGCDSAAITSPPAEPCSRPNRVRVTLADFDPRQDHVELDLAALVEGIDVASSVPRPPGCMSGPTDPDCGPVFGHLGLDLATGRCAVDCSDQKLATRAATGDV